MATSEPVKRSNHVFLSRMNVCECPNVPAALLEVLFLSGSMCEMDQIDLSRPLHIANCLTVQWTTFIQHFSHQWPLKALYNFHSFTHRLQCQTCKATASSSGAVRVRLLAQGHLGTRTSNLLVTSPSALPPEPHRAPTGLNAEDKCSF